MTRNKKENREKKFYTTKKGVKFYMTRNKKESREKKFYMTRNKKENREKKFYKFISLQSFGDGSVAQTVLSKGSVGSALSIHWSWGIGVTMGIYVAGGVSGAHLNPSVTVAQACLGRCPWRKILPYMLSQYLGAFLASVCVFLVYHGELV